MGRGGTGIQEKDSQVDQVRSFQERHSGEAGEALGGLKEAALRNQDTFSALMEAAKVCTLGQMSGALYGVGGKYRRSM